MKKLILAAVTIITMMLCMASPMFVKPLKANAAVGVAGETNASTEFIPLSDLIDYYGSDVCYVYMSATYSSSGSYTFFFVFDEATSIETDSNGYAINISGATLNGGSAKLYYRQLFVNRSDNYYRIDSLTEYSCSYLRINSAYSSFVVNDISSSNLTTIAFDSKLEASPPAPSLDLDVSFSPSMSGTVTRQGTANGADVTYNYLNLNIVNNGDNAQWLFCIVPHGQSLTFPESILNTPQGFFGNPTYVYIADEWIDWTNGLTGMTGNYGGIDMEMLYSPCAWHTLITGSDRTYHINWDMMKLTKDVSYDCVVYGMINEEPVNASASGSGLGCWTVKSALSDIQEVYRSTFTMPNPPEYNPNSIDEGNSSHPWDPDIDNSGLFNTGNVYKDANGNFVIKGSSSNSNNSGGSFYVSSSSVNNINNIFRNFFRFISGVLICFPSIYQNIIALGLSALIVVGVIKVAIK